ANWLGRDRASRCVSGAQPHELGLGPVHAAQSDVTSTSVMTATTLPVRLRWDGQRAEVWSWLPEYQIEGEALAQIRNIAALDTAARVAVMPVHKGYGMPIGSMFATRNAVVPYAVGVDIGCGMIAARTDRRVEELSRDRIRRVSEEICRRIPVGIPTRSDPKRG